MFADIYNQTNLFRIYRGREKVTKLFLSEDNDFQIILNLTADGINVDESRSNKDKYLVPGIGLVIISPIMLSRKKLGK